MFFIRASPVKVFNTHTCILALGYLHLHTCTWILTLAYLHLDAFTLTLTLGYSCFHSYTYTGILTLTNKLSLGYFCAIVSIDV